MRPALPTEPNTGRPLLHAHALRQADNLSERDKSCPRYQLQRFAPCCNGSHNPTGPRVRRVTNDSFKLAVS
jgi:hypothetical protein